LNAFGQSYKASLFHPNLGNEAVEGTIQLDRWMLRFQSPGLAEEIPVDRVIVELEEDSERVCLKDPDRPELRIFTDDLSILENRSFHAANAVRERMSVVATRREISRRLRLILYVFIGCAFVTMLGSWATGAMVRSLVAHVPPEWEEKFGEAEIEELRSAGAFVDDTNQVARLAALAAPLMQVVPAAKTGIKFHIQHDDDPNAFALPGGHVVVNTGLLRMVDTPEELLAVLAHELAHVSEKHIARHVISAAGPLVIFGVFFHSQNGLVNLLSAGSGIMVVQGFSQEYETEADDVGWKYLVAANIDPRGMAGTFRKFKALEGKQMAGLNLPQAFSSHPALDKRIARLDARWKRLSNKSGFQTLTNPIPKIASDPAHEKIWRIPKR
jgi:predicted Zn-dependent protease